MWNSARAVRGEHFAKGTEKYKIFGTLLDKEVEDLEDRGCPKVQDPVDEDVLICLSYPFRRKTTLRCAERKGKFFGIWIMRHLFL